LPHLLHFTKFGIVIFHVCALRLSRLAFDIFPFGQIAPIGFTSLKNNNINIADYKLRL